MPTDASVKAAAWLLLEAAEAVLRHLDTAADRGGVECRGKLRNAILVVGGEMPDAREAGQAAWDRLKEEGTMPGPYYVLPVDDAQTRLGFFVSPANDDWALVWRTQSRIPEPVFETWIPEAETLPVRWWAYPDIEALRELIASDVRLSCEWPLLAPKPIGLRALHSLEGGLTWHPMSELPSAANPDSPIP